MAEVRWALRDVSFEVAAGESVGLVGPNGAGKTTLLKIIAGIACPSSGSVEVRGRVATQFALGSAFDPRLSGRQNTFLQGTVLGLSNGEVRRFLPDIVEFAGLGPVIDDALWTYSRGMIGRLGLAVAAHARFDVMLLDEALSAGDARFRTRCREALVGFRRAGRTLVVVSHGVGPIRALCDRAVWLDAGVVREIGVAEAVLGHYTAWARARAAPRPAAPGPEI